MNWEMDKQLNFFNQDRLKSQVAQEVANKLKGY